MDKAQESQLQAAAASLSRAHKSKRRQSVTLAHTIIKKVVTDIYQADFTIDDVLRVEQTLNAEQANVPGKSIGIYEQIADLAAQVEIGIKQYATFKKHPATYVEIADISRLGGGGRQFRHGLPRDPLRNTFAKFREQLMTESMHREGDAILDRNQTNRFRLEAVIQVEQEYFAAYLAHRTREPEEKKQEHLKTFNRSMEKLLRKLEKTE